MRDFSRNLTLRCPTCANDQFISADEFGSEFEGSYGTSYYKCLDCGLVISENDLLDANNELIETNLEEICHDLEKELKEALK